MINFSKYSAILWDFDGVLMDSMPIREEGFRRVLSNYPTEEVSLLVNFHRKNGGLSRYVKFRYFFEKIKQSSIEENQVLQLASAFSKIMKELLMDEKLLIHDSMTFVKMNCEKIPMHIVSGSDGEELVAICKHLNIHQHFKSIHGSPTAKTQLVKELLNEYKYSPSATILIGDSLNDLEAARDNNIDFAGYNNVMLNNEGLNYIPSFDGHIIHNQ